MAVRTPRTDRRLGWRCSPSPTRDSTFSTRTRADRVATARRSPKPSTVVGVRSTAPTISISCTGRSRAGFDPQRVGLMGLSGGGYMTTWLLGHHPGRFRAGVSENPVSTWVSWYGGGDPARHPNQRVFGVGRPPGGNPALPSGPALLKKQPKNPPPPLFSL